MSSSSFRLGLFICACWALGCTTPVANRKHGGVEGTRADVSIGAGDKNGYAVRETCQMPNCFGVKGAGTGWYPQMERDRIGEQARFREGLNRFRDELLRLTGPAAIYRSGFERGCSGDSGLVLWGTNWRGVDSSLQQVGELLAREGLREEVTVCVAPNNTVEL